MKTLLPIAVAALALLNPEAQAAPGRPNFCGELKNAFGPYDHRDGNINNRVELVLGAHFTSDVQNLIRGSSGKLGGDIDYTLRALPNYTPALVAMARLSRKLKTEMPAGAHYPVECYFDRAIRFRPDDFAVRVAYGNYLSQENRQRDALVQFDSALGLAPRNPVVNYNVGLVNFKLGQFERANLYAHRAYALGFPLPGLKKMLQDAGRWLDVSAEQLDLPPEQGAPADTAAPPAPPAPQPAAGAPAAAPAAAAGAGQ